MKRFAAITFSVLMVVMMLLPTAFADDVVYKSSYVLSGFPSGAGSAVATGSEYGAFGGLIIGDINPSDIDAIDVYGEYDNETGDYIVTYDIRLTSLPDTESPLFYVALDSPIGVSLYIRARYRDTTWWALRASDMAHFSNTVPVIGTDLVDYSGQTDCYAVGINRHCFLGNDARFQIRVSDPRAVVNLNGHGSFLDTIYYPFNLIDDNFVVAKFVSSIWTANLIQPFFTLAVSGLALVLIVKFMR